MPEDNSYVVLEQLHQKWAAATEETEAAWHTLMVNPLDQVLRDKYFEKQHQSNQSCQEILEYKREKGV